MSGESTKRRKTTATAPASVPDPFPLPPELLETICGFLDEGTLCTVRLVCTQFNGAASRCIHSVELSAETLRSRPETTLSNFPNLSQVTVSQVKEDDLLMLANSHIADAVTHVRTEESLRQVPRRRRTEACTPVTPLPNLVSLVIYSNAAGRAFPYPQTLRELTLEGLTTDAAANLVTRLTDLTCLRVDDSFMRKPFAAMTALTALQRLEICTDLPPAPSVAKLTLLTHLQVTGAWFEDADLASLTGLHRLVHLGVQPRVGSGERQLLSCMASFTRLRSLDLGLCARPIRSAFETACLTPFSQLTALKLESKQLEAPFLPRLNLEGLQHLSVAPGLTVDRAGVAALRRATGLTELTLRAMSVGQGVQREDLGIALSRMSRLRALSVDTTTAAFTPCCEAIALLGELTNLKWRGDEIDLNAAAEVCLGLTKLRVLNLIRWNACPPPSQPITPGTFLALARLPELRMLQILRPPVHLGWGFVDDVCALVNAERHDRGWPPLQLSLD